ncbi:MAG TPA: hypothetical protein VGH73_23950 [Thermoanaerobaculia bacterium]|jgi:hypothetical protein
MANETKVPNVEVEELDDKSLEEASGGIESDVLDANGFMCNC